MASASNASPAAASSPWLFGPVWDLILGCGGFYFLIVAASSFAGAQIRALEPESFFPLLVILFLSPHYGATILRVYEKRKDRKAYAIFAVYITLALMGLFAVGLYIAHARQLIVPPGEATAASPAAPVGSSSPADSAGGASEALTLTVGPNRLNNPVGIDRVAGTANLASAIRISPYRTCAGKRLPR